MKAEFLNAFCEGVDILALAHAMVWSKTDCEPRTLVWLRVVEILV